jgi:flagellar protein FlaH
LTGGIPIPSLILVEGENDTGKSVIIQHLVWSALKQEEKVKYITTENTIRSLLDQMKNLTWDLTTSFLRGDLKILPLHIQNVKWDEDIARYFLLTLMASMKADNEAKLIIIDSLSYIMTFANVKDTLSFFSEIRNFVDRQGKCVLMSIHPYVLDTNMMTRVRSICDGHITLQKKVIGGNTVRMVEVAKMRGARKSTSNIISFEVDPNFGIRVVPISQARA